MALKKELPGTPKGTLPTPRCLNAVKVAGGLAAKKFCS